MYCISYCQHADQFFRKFLHHTKGWAGLFYLTRLQKLLRNLELYSPVSCVRVLTGDTTGERGREKDREWRSLRWRNATLPVHTCPYLSIPGADQAKGSSQWREYRMWRPLAASTEEWRKLRKMVRNFKWFMTMHRWSIMRTRTTKCIYSRHNRTATWMVSACTQHINTRLSTVLSILYVLT